jgi:hypothetical protein
MPARALDASAPPVPDACILSCIKGVPNAPDLTLPAALSVYGKSFTLRVGLAMVSRLGECAALSTSFLSACANSLPPTLAVLANEQPTVLRAFFGPNDATPLHAFKVRSQGAGEEEMQVIFSSRVLAGGLQEIEKQRFPQGPTEARTKDPYDVHGSPLSHQLESRCTTLEPMSYR